MFQYTCEVASNIIIHMQKLLDSDEFKIEEIKISGTVEISRVQLYYKVR